jgi:simple sugar transport system permease protein
MMSGVSDALTIFADAAFWRTAIAIAAPLLFAAIGAIVCGQSGVLSLNIEGVVTAGALTAWLTAHAGKAPWTAVAVATVVGAVAGFCSTALTSRFRLPQRLTGLAMSLLLVALCQSVFAVAFPAGTHPPNITPFAPIDLSWVMQLPHVSRVSELPYLSGLGRALFHAAAPVYVILLLTPVAAYVIYRTPLGMALRACGRNPDAVIAQGRSVHGLRMGAGIVGAALMAVGGATLALTGSGAFSFGLVSGRGFAAFMLALIAGWRIGRTFLAVLAFAMIDSYQSQLQQHLGAPLAVSLAPLLPYAIAFIVFIATSRSIMRRLALPPD